jgi:hypothetical protein
MPLDRRTLLQIVPGAALARTLAAQATHCGTNPTAQAGPYTFQFFTPEQAALVDTLMEHIIPADEHSPGAHAARAVEFADVMLAVSEDYVKEDWQIALAQVSEQLKNKSVDEWLARVSQNEASPQAVEDIFFRSLKQMTINGYYSSTTGIHDDLHYQGNTHVAVFKGCDHAAHKG